MTNKRLSLFTFPIWWYSEGLQLALAHCQSGWRFVMRSTGILIFMRNLTQPLYGDTTREGRIISIFLRFFLLIFLLIWTGLRLAWVLVLFLVHVVALPVALIMLVYQIFSLFI